MNALTRIEAQASPSSDVSSVASAAPPVKHPFPTIPPVPTQEGPLGIRFDFNNGARIMVPRRPRGGWRVCIEDLQAGNVLLLHSGEAFTAQSTKRFFIGFRITAFLVDETGALEQEEPVLVHEYDASDRHVMIAFPVGTLGDTIAWFSSAVRFRALHGCRLTCVMSELISPLFERAYPDIRFLTREAFDAEAPDDLYASYRLGLFFGDHGCVHQPTDFRQVGLHRTAAYILGTDDSDVPPDMLLPDETPPIAEPYVCIGIQASAQCKYWNNPYGWSEVIFWLKRQGYRVICIDQKAVHGSGLVWNAIPNGCEDMTGDIPLIERARLLRHAALFIGLSSGLAWLAWLARCPVVMISGFTHPTNEFRTAGRVINWHSCNSCWNDQAVSFDHADFLWCPRHKGTERQFECTRLISASSVIAAASRTLKRSA